MKFILDTSYWIEFFKVKQPLFSTVQNLLEDQNVIALSFVFGELMQGCKFKKEMKIIFQYWESLPKINETNVWIDAGNYSFKHSLINKGVGIIDAAILVTSLQSNAQILTLDKKLLSHIDEIGK